MRVGILGSGDVARALAGGFLEHGHEVMLGTRDPSKLTAWRRENPNAEIGSTGEAAHFSDLAVLAVKGTVAARVLTGAASKLYGKPVIDTSNPLADASPTSGVLEYFTSPNESLMERLQRAAPGVHLVKAFNSVGNARMVNPVYAGGRPTMFICGNNQSAKETVTRILEEFGWETEDMGGVEAARAIEPLCMLWCIPGFLRNEWTHAFKLLR